ncbi:hypothetical protein BOX15_Mlig016869g3, partial [Macrostomum lignano]
PQKPECTAHHSQMDTDAPAASAAAAADSSSAPTMDSGLFADSGIGATEMENEISSASSATPGSLCFRDMMSRLPPVHRQGLKRLIGYAQRQKNPRLIGTRIAVEQVDFLAELDDYDRSGFLLDCLFKRAGFDAATCARMRLVSSRWRQLVDRFGTRGGPARSDVGAGGRADKDPTSRRHHRRRRRKHRRATLDSSSTSSIENRSLNESGAGASRRSSLSAASTVVPSAGGTFGDAQLSAAVAMETSPAPSTSSPAWPSQPPRRALRMAPPVAVVDSFQADAGEAASVGGSSGGGGRLFDAFVEESKRLVNNQGLRPCPRCRWPARVDPDTRIGRCTRPETECGFAFCLNCLTDGHLYRHCPFLLQTSPVKPPPPPKQRLSLKKRLHRL